jgi:hypothetical protein
LDKYNNCSAEDIAKEISDLAYHNSKLRDFDSPFAKKALDNDKKYIGGKQDDITVIVAQVNQPCETFSYSDNTSSSE